jgi:hypothetical protein
MTRGSIREYIEAVRVRYLKANKKEKGLILDEFIQVTGYHRKAAVRLLCGYRSPQPSQRRGRKRHYGEEISSALYILWEASDHLCSKRLKPFIGELIRILRRHEELAVNSAVEAELNHMSPSTIDRLLKPWRQLEVRRPLSTTKPGSLLKKSIPIRTFADWKEEKPGFLEVDLVAHCGESTDGFYLTTLSAVDVASGWSECIGVWGKGQDRVGAAIHQVRERLPFPLLGLDSDNGSEFINQNLYNYCRKKKITFTRSRPYKKNDSCHIEQKNWSLVRRVIGYDRYSSHAALERLNLIYAILRQYVNFFQPTMKLISKTRHGAKVHKVYDIAKTPYQRLLESGDLTPAKQTELSAIYHGLNPVQLLRQLNANVGHLWKMAERTYPIKKAENDNISVTRIFESMKAVR